MRVSAAAVASQCAVPCKCALNSAKSKLLVLLDPLHLLLVEPGDDGANAAVRMAVPLRHQEAFVDRSNACVLHLTVRSPLRPYAGTAQLSRLPPCKTHRHIYGDG